MAFAGVAAYVFLGLGAETRLHAQSAWVGQVIAKYGYEHHDAGTDLSQLLGTAVYNVILGADGTPTVLGDGRMATTRSAAFTATHQVSSPVCGISQRKISYGSGEGGKHHPACALQLQLQRFWLDPINGGSDSIFFEILNEHETRFSACQSHNSKFTSSIVVFPFSTFVPAPADDRWVITGEFNGTVLSNINSCSGATCQQNTVSRQTAAGELHGGAGRGRGWMEHLPGVRPQDGPVEMGHRRRGRLGRRRGAQGDRFLTHCRTRR